MKLKLSTILTPLGMALLLSACGGLPLVQPEDQAKTTAEAAVGDVAPATPTPAEAVFQSPLPTPVGPTPTPQATPPVVVPGPLSPGLKIVTVEGCWEKEQVAKIWMANVDDLNHVQVISELPCHGDVPGVYPSPDNRHLAYIVPRSSIWNSTLGVMGIDGANNKTLDSPVVGWGTEIDLFWSPDSKWIAYTRAKFSGVEVTDEDEIWLAQPTTEEKKLIATLPSGWLVGWSSDSSRLYYYSGRELWVLNMDEKIAPEVLVKFELPVNVRLSPDGQKILYLQQREAKPSPPDLITMKIDTRETHTVASQVRKEKVAFYNYQLHPIWSPDSSQVVYNPVVNSQYMELVALPWDASRAATTIRSREDVYYYPVSWSPDGRFIFTLQRPLTTDEVVPFRQTLISSNGGQQEVHPISPDTLTLNFAGWLEEKD